MTNNWLNLENKVAVVTGALAGMGSKICKKFAMQGTNVVLVDLLVDKARE
ncbi:MULTISPECIES: SDR family NAD(P)-dependent oxidoreductase [unclassified Gemella]|nr:MULTISPECIES: SDR family NAD(P)-dependent oxidoreductase [unclassified Gemella]MBU0278589.1 SDR family NAD(P)-dependent oxidoreductase [Gemella sp. zg-1178]QWQ38286.1 SDR family NAD(P)-dependent oxidoreductase [Gemella sp. zg-570]